MSPANAQPGAQANVQVQALLRLREMILTGLSARLSAERGAPPLVLNEARESLHAIDTELSQPTLNDDPFSRYATLNARFHTLRLTHLQVQLPVAERHGRNDLAPCPLLISGRGLYACRIFPAGL